MNGSFWIVAALSLALCTAADLRTGYYRGRLISFENQGGLAVYQGDIVLGTTADLETAGPPKQAERKESTGVVWQSLLWPEGVIPYTIDPAFSSFQRNEILSAIRHWNENTPIRLVERTIEAIAVQFLTDNDPYSCRSTIGMSTRAMVLLPTGCGTRETIHEIGHTVGLWHEHTRTDRNRYITVLYENMERRYASQFNEQVENGRDLGPYDFNSIMHYAPWDFAREASLQVMETVPAGIEFGGVFGLSAGDIAAVRQMYAKPVAHVTLSTTPSGLRLRVDGAMVDDGATLEWAAGSRHTIEAGTQGDDLTRYVFANWSHGGPAIQEVQASPGAVFVASFITEHRITASVSPPGAGTVSVDPPSPDGFYPLRARIRFRAVPADGFHFLRWPWSASRSANPAWRTVTSPASVGATFVREPVISLNSDPPGRNLTVDGGLVSTPANFAWARDELHSVGIDTTQPAFARYRFLGWDDGGPQTRAVIPDGSSRAYVARFARQFQLTVQTNSTSNRVSVNPSSPDGYYDEGTVVQLTAEPARFFAFLGWSGDLAGNASTVNLRIDSQKIVLATFGSPNQVKTMAIVGAATASEGAVAPGQLITVYGNQIGPASPQNLEVRDGRVTTEAAGTQVLFDGQPAPITYAASHQINAVVPYGVSGKTAVALQVRSGVRTSALPDVAVKEAAPGIFTADSSGRGQAAALNQNGTFNSSENPAARGSVIVLYATGEGLVTPAAADGQVAASVYPKPELPVSVRIGGRPGIVHYAGAAPGFVTGLLQVNVEIPMTIETGGKVPVSLVIGNQSSPTGVTIAVH